MMIIILLDECVAFADWSWAGVNAWFYECNPKPASARSTTIWVQSNKCFQ